MGAMGSRSKRYAMAHDATAEAAAGGFTAEERADMASDDKKH